MKKELLLLYKQFIEELNDYNVNHHNVFEDKHEPTFELFIKWLSKK